MSMCYSISVNIFNNMLFGGKMNKSKVFTFVIFALCIYLLMSCEMFSFSIAKSFSRDYSDLLSDASVNELLSLAQDVESGNVDIAASLLNEFSEEDLSKLTIKEKESILELAFDATLSMGSLSNLTGELFDDDVKVNYSIFLGKVFDEVRQCNTDAINELLSSPDVLKSASTDILSTAAITSTFQLIANSELNTSQEAVETFEKVVARSEFQNVDENSVEILASALVAELYPSAKDDNKNKLESELTNSLNVLLLLSGNDLTVDNETINRQEELGDTMFLGLVPISDMLGSFNFSNATP